jgi:hypothetical protein
LQALLKHLFKYPTVHGPLPDSELLAFYWKGGVKGLDQEVVLLEIGGEEEEEEEEEEEDGDEDNALTSSYINVPRIVGYCPT